jgi:hypothetical protein
VDRILHLPTRAADVWATAQKKEDTDMLKHTITAACGALAVAGTMTLSAQTQPRPTTPRPSPSTPSRTDEKITTVTGCLKAWDATTGAPATTPAPGATTPGAPANRFVLTNIEPNPMTAPSEGAPARAGGGAPIGGKQYVLTADTGVNLAAHLNHKVRVTGKVIAAPEHSAADATRPPETTRPAEVPAPRPADPPRTADQPDMTKAFTTLAVSSVTMISATCTGATS